MHHVFFTLVLPTVFEWCALSDFFMPDEMFHAYPKEENGRRHARTLLRGARRVQRVVCSTVQKDCCT